MAAWQEITAKESDASILEHFVAYGGHHRDRVVPGLAGTFRLSVLGTHLCRTMGTKSSVFNIQS